MARRQIGMKEIMEAIYQWHQGISIRRIRDSLGIERRTIKNYLTILESLGIRRGSPLPEPAQLAEMLKANLGSRDSALTSAPAQKAIDAFHSQIAQWMEEEDMTAKQVWRLLNEKGLDVGYTSIKRYFRREFPSCKRGVTVRLEVSPGHQAQVDFGYVGLMNDPETGKLRRTWVFIMTHASSRYPFVRFVFNQDQINWVDCHCRAFEFFSGVPATVVLDNLKAGVIKPDIYDPTINRAYSECERYYGFVADPAKSRSPKLKGKVERGVPVVRQQILAGRVFENIHKANERALYWCRHEYGMEIHGTTKRRPFEVFEMEEKAALKPLPQEPFEFSVWKRCTVHPDHHVVFEKSYYSVPTRFIGQEVWVRGTNRVVQVFHNESLVKTHLTAKVPGTWRTDQMDYPPDKAAYLMATPTYCRNQAERLGPYVFSYVEKLLKIHAMKNLRKAQSVIRLGEKYGARRLDMACERALCFENLRYHSLKEILERGLEESPSTERETSLVLSPMGQGFLRPGEYFTQKTREVAP
jgi:transposase